MVLVWHRPYLIFVDLITVLSQEEDRPYTREHFSQTSSQMVVTVVTRKTLKKEYNTDWSWPYR